MIKSKIKIPKEKNKSQIIEYFKKNNLWDFIKSGLNNNITIKPDLRDLYLLHEYVVLNKRISVLEFGCGWSTQIIANALIFNKNKHEKLVKKEFRIKKNFKIITLETSKKFLDICKNRSKFKNIEFIYSQCKTSNFNNRICSYYKKIPSFNPDFIYLDGPDPMEVIPNKKFSNKSIDLPPMSGDILLMENFLLPGTIIVVDGRTSNARFLKNNFQRNWLYWENKKNDQNIFYLDESPLGDLNKKQINFYKS